MAGKVFERRNQLRKLVFKYRITVYHTNFSAKKPRTRRIMCETIWTCKLDQETLRDFVKSTLGIERISKDYRIECLELERAYYSLPIDQLVRYGRKEQE